MDHQELRDCDPARWADLGELLIRKRIEISPRYRKRSVFAREKGLNCRQIADIEKARRRDFSLPTIIAVEQIYKLGPGFIRRYLNGSDEADDTNGSAAA